jgi:hypothetical protein
MRNQLLNQDIYIGTTAAGVVWKAYGDRHTYLDLQIMISRIRKFGGEPSARAVAMLRSLPWSPYTAADLTRLARAKAL